MVCHGKIGLEEAWKTPGIPRLFHGFRGAAAGKVYKAAVCRETCVGGNRNMTLCLFAQPVFMAAKQAGKKKRMQDDQKRNLESDRNALRGLHGQDRKRP